MCAPHFMAIHPIAVEAFTKKQKCKPQGDGKGKVSGSSKSIRFILILGTVKVSTKFHCNPSNSS